MRGRLTRFQLISKVYSRRRQLNIEPPEKCLQKRVVDPTLWRAGTEMPNLSRLLCNSRDRFLACFRDSRKVLRSDFSDGY